MTKITWSPIEIPKHKGDQEGKNVYPQHVYANPDDPSVCTILHLGVMIVCPPKIFLVDNRVFGGGSTKNKFSKWLVSLFNTISHCEMMTLVLFLRTRRSFVQSRNRDSYSSQTRRNLYDQHVPQCGMVYTIGNVQQPYIFSIEGGDQMVDRILCGGVWNSDDLLHHLLISYNTRTMECSCSWLRILSSTL